MCRVSEAYIRFQQAFGFEHALMNQGAIHMKFELIHIPRLEAITVWSWRDRKEKIVGGVD